MNKVILPLVLAALLGNAVAPAFAEDSVFGFSPVYVAQDIAAQGYDVVAVEEWGNYVVATVKDDQGHQSFKYFNPDTLTLVR